MPIKIYTSEDCPYCTAAMRLLRKRDLDYTEIELANDPALVKQMVEQTGQTSTPYIFIDGRHIGGFDELVEMDQEGTLGNP